MFSKFFIDLAVECLCMVMILMISVLGVLAVGL